MGRKHVLVTAVSYNDEHFVAVGVPAFADLLAIAKRLNKPVLKELGSSSRYYVIDGMTVYFHG